MTKMMPPTPDCWQYDDDDATLARPICWQYDDPTPARDLSAGSTTTTTPPPWPETCLLAVQQRRGHPGQRPVCWQYEDDNATLARNLSAGSTAMPPRLETCLLPVPR